MIKNAWIIVITLLIAACDQYPWNDPYTRNQSRSNVGYSSFSSPPKTLDPARSYTAEENVFIAQIYEPILQYHLLKRPYTLVPLTAMRLPRILYLDKKGQKLAQNSNPQEIAFSVYEIAIKPGIYYQRHPAFAKNKQGQFLYHHLSQGEINSIKQLKNFSQEGTRELIADDYVYEIKRLAKPGVNSPIFGLMSSKILGLQDYAMGLNKLFLTKKFLDLRDYPLAGAKSLDRYHYQIIIKGQYPQFIYWLSMGFFAPIPWEADAFYSQPGMAENNMSFDWYPIGTGPYRLVENNPNRRMILEKNELFHPEYYPTEGEPGDVEAGYLKLAGKRLPFLDRMIFLLEKEYVPRWNKFLQGYYDQSAISSDSFDQAIQVNNLGQPYLTPNLAKMGVYLQTSTALMISYMGFNMRDPIVGGDSERARNLRLALSIAVDYDEYIHIFLNGRGLAAQGPLPPGIFGYLKGPQGINPYVYEWKNNQPERKSIIVAKQLMRQAGYKNGIDPKTGESLILNYDVATTSGPEEKGLLDWMRSQFAKLGIQLNIRGTQYNRFQEIIRVGRAQIYSLAWVADYPDPENFLFLLYGPNGKVLSEGENVSNYHNVKFDRLFNEMKSMSNNQERQKIINQMVEIVRHDAPWIWGVNPKIFTLNQVWVQRVKPNAIVNNTLKYQKLDPLLRYHLRVAWNRKLLWPVAIFCLFLVFIAVPVFIRYGQKERQSVKDLKK